MAKICTACGVELKSPTITVRVETIDRGSEPAAAFYKVICASHWTELKAYLEGGVKAPLPKR